LMTLYIYDIFWQFLRVYSCYVFRLFTDAEGTDEALRICESS
jgi:hypothetical protein